MYIRKTKDIYQLWWNGECVDEFDTRREAVTMRKEYQMAYNGCVSIRKTRERIVN